MVNLSTVQHEKLLVLIDQIYQAASNPGLWEDFCHELSGFLDVGCISFGYIDFEHDDVQFSISSLLKPHELEEHATKYKNSDPWIKALNENPAGIVYEGTDLVSTVELESSEYYQKFWKRFNMPLMHAGLFKKEDCRIGAIAMHSSTEHGHHTEIQVHMLNIVLQHLSRAMEIYRHLYRACSERDMAMQALSSQNIGLLIINGIGEVTYLNSKAKKLIKNHSQLKLQDKKLLLHSKHLFDQIRYYLDSCRLDLQQQQTIPRENLTIITEENGSDYRLQIQLMQYLTDNIDERKMLNTPKIMVLIKLLDKTQPYSAEYLAQNHGLTPAESRVASLLSQGRSYQLIADELNIGKETIKTHSRSIYRKTNTTNQTDFVLFMSTGLQP